MPTSVIERTTAVVRMPVAPLLQSILQRGVPALLVSLSHLVALTWLISVTSRPIPQVVPPSITGKLVSMPVPGAASASPLPVKVPAKPEPAPSKSAPTKPERPRPKPVPKEKIKPVSPIPNGPPSPRAVKAPPTRALPQQNETESPAASAPPPSASSPAPQAAAKEAEPAVTPPRSDASQLNNPTPAYPPLSRRLHEQGRVLLDVYILADGSVGEIRIRRSSGHPRLDEVARDAVSRWRYVPARRGNEAIPFWYIQPIDFRLDS
jgi:periplasmic protein TonB